MATISNSVISRSQREESGQNLSLLQEQALSTIQKLADESWTDHNPADPGITILEVLAFVISDLSYRLGFSVRDLMAWPEKDNVSTETPFWLAPQILPSNAVTLTDYQKLIMDTPGVRAVLLEKNSSSQRYEVMIDSDDSFAINTNAKKMELANTIRHRFLNERNVNEDIANIRYIEKHPVALSLDLVFGSIENPLVVLVDILNRLTRVISPFVDRQSLDDLLNTGLSPDKIFDGPLPSNGFITSDQLKTDIFPQSLFASDLMSALDDVSDLKIVRQLTFITLAAINDGSDDDIDNLSDEVHWRYDIDPEKFGNTQIQSLSLDLTKTLERLTLEIDGQNYILSAEQKEEVIDLIYLANQESQRSSVSYSNTGSSEQLELTQYTQGCYRELAHYQSLQYEFPVIYKLVDDQLNNDIDSSELVKVIQLKGFLTLFDQILCDQFAQLETLKTLLALPSSQTFCELSVLFDKMLASESLTENDGKLFWQAVQALPKTTLSQPLTNISGLKNLLGEYLDEYVGEGFQSYAEPIFSWEQLDRINRSLTHLLARFSESTLDANLLQFQKVFAFYRDSLVTSAPSGMSIGSDFVMKLVALKQATLKASLLADYPRLSRLRSGGANYLNIDIYSHFTASLSHRILRFLGVNKTNTMPLATGNREGFYLLESTLLWPGRNDENLQADANTLYFVMPDWPTRFAHSGFRALLEQQIVRESPAHQNVVVIYLNRVQMSTFEQLFFTWLNAMTQCPFPVYDGSELISLGDTYEMDWLVELVSSLRDCIDNLDFSSGNLSSYLQSAVGTSTIREDFRVAFTPLEFLKPIFAIGEATINPANADVAAFTVDIQTPNRIEELT